jgi:LmbE family N-acetylglucosaminyl deacetylase
MTTTTFEEPALLATAPLATRTHGAGNGLPIRHRSGQREHFPQHDLARLGTTVAVWAHPDDETYLAGGLLAALRDAGQRVVCVTATRGDAGNGLHDGGSAAARSALGDLRVGELDAALEVLGVEEHRWLDYVDAECSAVDENEAVDRLVDLFDEVQPQTVVSFGPDGFTGHPDHRAVAHWTRQAVERWRPRPLLLQAVSTEEDREAARDIDERFVAHGWSFPPSVRVADLTVRVLLDDSELDRKVKALRQQFSQTARLIKDVGERRFASWVSAESFCAAA